MGIYLGTSELGGGGGGAVIGAYTTFFLDTTQDIITTDDNSIWLKTGVALSPDGTGSATDSATYPDAFGTIGPTGTTVQIPNSGGGGFDFGNNGFYFEWWSGRLLYIAGDEYHIIPANTAGTGPDTSAFSSLVRSTNSLGDGFWMPAFREGNKQYSVQAASNENIGRDSYVIDNGDQVFEVTGDWPNYTAVGSAVGTVPNFNIARFLGWASDGTDLIISGQQYIHKWTDWKTSSAGTTINSLGNIPIVQTQQDTYWRATIANARSVANPITAAAPLTEFNISDDTATGRTVALTGANGASSGNRFVFFFPTDTSATSWYGFTSRTTGAGGENTYTLYDVGVGDPTARFSRGFSTNGTTDTIDLTHPLYVKIGNATT